MQAPAVIVPLNDGGVLGALELDGRVREMIETTDVHALSAERALGIAQEDAIAAYRNLSLYRIRLELESDGWHVDYELKDVKLKGGGPHYVIDRHSGVIVSRRYEQ